VSALLRATLGALAFTLLLLAGCAQPPLAKTPAAQETPSWRGRLALRLESQEPKAFYAGFELTGDARRGELIFFNPLGNALASLRWTPDSAILRDDGQTRRFDSLDALTTEATGTALPITALFQWLDGQPAAAAGWQADLSQLAQGRLLARRTQPEPVAELRLILEP
jgi:outer membrane lipoprotein LolB